MIDVDTGASVGATTLRLAFSGLGTGGARGGRHAGRAGRASGVRSSTSLY